MKRLESVFDLNWKPRVVVEASAGTGKTYTIVGLYIRLLLEKKAWCGPNSGHDVYQ